MAKLWKGIFYCKSSGALVQLGLCVVDGQAQQHSSTATVLTLSSLPSSLRTRSGFWMSDKPLVQQALAQELADLVLTVPGTSRVPAPLVAGFDSSAGDISKRARGGLAMLEGFWDAMAREWSGLDKWR